MREFSRRIAVAVAAAAAAFSIQACDADPVFVVGTGWLQIQASTTGSATDPDGYTVAIDGGVTVPIAVDGTVTIPTLQPGSRSVELGDLDTACTVSSANPAAVTIVAGDTVAATFSVACNTGSGSGTVIVTTATSGDTTDPDGYTAALGTATMAIGVTDTITFSGVAAGDNSVLLSGLDANCSVADSATRTATITGSDTASVDFQVTCQAPAPTSGTVIVRTATTGDTLDPDGYTATIGADAMAMAVNDTVVFLNVAVGDNSVVLSGVATNCSVADSATRTATLTGSDTAAVDFQVTCTAPVSPPSVGEWIAITTDRDGNDEIYLIKPDGTGAVNLTADAGADRHAAWAPDSTRLAFQSNRDGDFEIWIINADGTGLTQVTTNTSNERAPSWSPDGTRLAFVSDRDGNDEVYVANVDGTGEVNVSNDGTAADTEPDWSPDGSLIAFATDRDGNLEVYTVAPDGTGATNVSNDATGGDWAPVWSPDGTQIAFTSSRDGNNEIYVMAAGGTGATNLTNHAGNDGSPAWAPDGTQLAFRTDRAGNDEIYLMASDGTGANNLTNDPASDRLPAWGRALR